METFHINNICTVKFLITFIMQTDALWKLWQLILMSVLALAALANSFLVFAVRVILKEF